MDTRRAGFAKPLVAAVALALFVTASAACSSSGSRGGSNGSHPGTGSETVAAAASIHWSTMQNPLLQSPSHAVKDPAVVFAHGAWHALVSAVDRNGRWRIGLYSSRDLRTWSALTTMPHDAAVDGEASPDVVHAPDGRWVVTYQSFVHDRNGGSPKLYYRTTADFEHFSAARPLGRDLHPAAADRMIDAAIAYTPAGLLLGYKYGGAEQHFEIARSTTGSLDGPWKLIGRPDITIFGDTIENYQFVHLDRGWQLLATSNIGDYPFVFTLEGAPQSPSSWLHWTVGRQLQVPLERWNHGKGAPGGTFEHANCAYLVNSGPIGGKYYLVYSDASNKTTFGGEGPAVVAIARSPDLVSWSVPPH